MPSVERGLEQRTDRTPGEGFGSLPSLLAPPPPFSRGGPSPGRDPGHLHLPGLFGSQKARRDAPAPGCARAKESEGSSDQSAASACGRAPLATRVRAAAGSAPVGGA
ncbi:unnamed protein product [Rangifer tarandus platyrhynchus]|uniref:Uncharacterized protein n=1 Tax=Rangifer tarandus platyrhynchus TaxID=3082113 RepID=A0ABN9A5S4_RANTA|nr:unnamed protein product [Rangifer tarandus platyrhynchus]